MKQSMVIFFLFLPFAAWNEESVQQTSQEAEALWEARDFSTASDLYEQLLQRSLPIWQQARVFYNLGTIRLAQQQTNTAFSLFQKITPTDLALPRFGRDLFLNLGIADWQHAQTLSTTADYSSLAQQALYLEQSLQAFSQAQSLECGIQQEEQKESTFSCHPLSLIEQWSKVARLQLDVVHSQQRRQWIEQASIEMLATLLDQRMKELINRLKTLQSEDSKISSTASFILYFQHQINSLVMIWEGLNQKDLSPSQRTSFEQGAAFYLHAMQALTKQDFTSVLENLNKAKETLASFTFQDNIALQQALLHYEILLLQESLTGAGLQKLIDEFDQLKVKDSQMQSLEQIKTNLQDSLKSLQDNHLLETRFFLVAGLNQVDSLLKEKKTTAILVLQQAIRQAQRALQLFLLAQVIADEADKKGRIQAILNDQQQVVLANASPFIPTVLKEQEILFQQAQGPASGCQQSPWEQVIPLFDQGLQAAQSAAKQLKGDELTPRNIVIEQKQTIKDWEQALNFMQHPPKQNPPPTDGKSAPQNLTETFRLIQEMYLEDQPQPTPTNQELHSW